MFSLNRSSNVNTVIPSWDAGALWIVGRQWRLGDRGRRGAGQSLGIACIVREGDGHLDSLAFVCGNQGIAGGRGAADRGVVGQPLVGEGCVDQTVGVGDVRGDRRERLTHLRCAADDGSAGGRRVFLWPRNHQRQATGQLSPVTCADGALGGAVRGGIQHYGHVGVGVPA